MINTLNTVVQGSGPRLIANLLSWLIAASSLWATSPAYDYTIVAKTGDVIDGVTVTAPSIFHIADDPHNRAARNMRTLQSRQRSR